jgi:hypothetical protein
MIKYSQQKKPTNKILLSLKKNLKTVWFSIFVLQKEPIQKMIILEKNRHTTNIGT